CFILNADFNGTFPSLVGVPLVVDIILNSSTVQSQKSKLDLDTTYGDGKTCTFILLLNAQDTITFSISQNSGSTITMHAGSQATRISGFKIY
ncbi:MAG: hypothetical protein OEQ53_18975, partial [Saprospiraceae bacterium]|nr:hypothetical protein [Saprospiraceae bacterium]